MDVPDRMPLPPRSALTDAQRAAVNAMTEGPRGGVPGPFTVLLRSPELLLRMQHVGEYLRFDQRSALTPQIREFTVLIVARYWSQRFEWSRHVGYALEAGITPEICAAIAEGRRPSDLEPSLAASYDTLNELLHNRALSQPTFEAAADHLGERTLVEMICHAGYYATLAMLMNAAGTPTTGGPELPSLP